MIKLQIIGHIGKDCLTKEVNGKSVINFSVAHTEKFKDAQGNLKERTTWVECNYWTDRTAIAPYLKKGTMVYVEGAPSADAYLNKDNQPMATLRIRVGNIQLLGNRNDQQAQPVAAATSNANANASHGVPAASTGLEGPVSATDFSEAADDLPF